MSCIVHPKNRAEFLCATDGDFLCRACVEEYRPPGRSARLVRKSTVYPVMPLPSGFPDRPAWIAPLDGVRVWLAPRNRMGLMLLLGIAAMAALTLTLVPTDPRYAAARLALTLTVIAFGLGFVGDASHAVSESRAIWPRPGQWGARLIETVIWVVGFIIALWPVLAVGTLAWAAAVRLWPGFSEEGFLESPPGRLWLGSVALALAVSVPAAAVAAADLKPGAMFSPFTIPRRVFFHLGDHLWLSATWAFVFMVVGALELLLDRAEIEALVPGMVFPFVSRFLVWSWGLATLILVTAGRRLSFTEPPLGVVVDPDTAGPAEIAQQVTRLGQRLNENPEDIGAAMELAALAERGIPTHRAVQAVPEAIDLLLRHGSPDRAAVLYNGTCETERRFTAQPVTMMKLAQHFESNRAWEDAIDCWKKLGLLFPASPVAPEALLRAAALYHEKLRQPSKAAKLLLHLLENHPVSPHTAEAEQRLEIINAAAGEEEAPNLLR